MKPTAHQQPATEVYYFFPDVAHRHLKIVDAAPNVVLNCFALANLCSPRRDANLCS